jgi:hypothetical protein
VNRHIKKHAPPKAHLTFVEDFAAKQRLAKRKEVAIACLYDFAPHDFA